MAIQLRRGTNAQWEALKSNIVVGELATTYDSERAFLGTGSGTYFEMANIELIADEFDSSASYAEGDVCIYQGKLYQFTADHSGAWSGTDVEQVTASEVGSGGTAISDLQDNALIHRTASGSITSFSDGSDMPMDSLIADINPVQSGSGDPSPTNIRPISGWDSVDVNVRGRNMLKTVPQTRTANGITATLNSDGTITVNGTATATSVLFQNFEYPTTSPFDQNIGKKCIPNGTYHISMDAPSNNYRFQVIASNNKSVVDDIVTIFNANQGTFTIDDTYAYNWARFYVSNGTVANNVTLYPMLRLSSDTDASFEPYNGNTTTVDLGRTVYGGSLNVTTGVLTIDMALVDLGTLNWSVRKNVGMQTNGLSSSIKNPSSNADVVNAICSQYKASSWTALVNSGTSSGLFGVSGGYLAISTTETDATAFKTAMSGVQLVYELATQTTVQLTPTQVNTLLGQNNVWADSGDVEVTYKANASLTIEEIINAITALGGNV